jgi:hypothetical protein
MMAVQIGGLVLEKRKQFMSISPGITYETDKEFSYSRARGLFAGVSLEGSTIRPDNDAN